MKITDIKTFTVGSFRFPAVKAAHSDAVFLPINGVGNNMNAVDSARFAVACGAKVATPLHFGLFDEPDPTSFTVSNCVIPTPWEAIA